MSATDAADAIEAALNTVEGLTVKRKDPGANLLSFPAAVVLPPVLGWSTYNTSLPTDATFYVVLVVKADAQALPALESAISEVVAALWNVRGAAVTSAAPAAWPVGGQGDLPAYRLTVEVTL